MSLIDTKFFKGCLAPRALTIVPTFSAGSTETKSSEKQRNNNSFANQLEMIKHCLAILFSGRDSRSIQNLIILNKIFNFRESRPVSLRATTLGTFLLRPRKYLKNCI